MVIVLLDRTGLELELLVRDRLEAEPVKRGDAPRHDRRAVLRGGVADMVGEAPSLVDQVDSAHVTVPRDLGDDGRGGDRGGPCVTVNHRALLVAGLRDRETVAEADATRARDAQEGVAQRGDIGHVKTLGVDPADAARDDGDLGRGPENHGVQRLACLEALLLGVVQRRERATLTERQALVVEEDRSGDQRPGETPASGLVRPGDEPRTELAVEAEEATARLRGGRSAPAASTSRTRCR